MVICWTRNIWRLQNMGTIKWGNQFTKGGQKNTDSQVEHIQWKLGGTGYSSTCYVRWKNLHQLPTGNDTYVMYLCMKGGGYMVR